MAIAASVVVVTRNGSDFNFKLMQDFEMCGLVEQLIEEINRRKENKTDVGFWDENGNYKKDLQPIKNPIEDYGITINRGLNDFKNICMPLGVNDKKGVPIIAGDILLTDHGCYCLAIMYAGQPAVESPGSHAIDIEKPAFFNECEAVTNIRYCPDYFDKIADEFENVVDIEIPQDAENVCYKINNFEINIPDLENTHNIMKHHATQLAVPFIDKRAEFLNNLTEMLQCVYGVQIGFQNEDIKRLEVG